MPGKCGKPEFLSNKLQSHSFFPTESETRIEATVWLDPLRKSVEGAIISLSFSSFFSGNLNPYQNLLDISALLLMSNN